MKFNQQLGKVLSKVYPANIIINVIFAFLKLKTLLIFHDIQSVSTNCMHLDRGYRIFVANVIKYFLTKANLKSYFVNSLKKVTCVKCLSRIPPS